MTAADAIGLDGMMRPRILVLFAHPDPQGSRINRAMIDGIRDLPNVHLRDLYETYPDFIIDVPAEQALLSGHDVIVLQHPLYWYSCPALMKEWIDEVLEYGWAYGSGGDALRGKELTQAVSTGGPESSYLADGYNQVTVTELLRPFERTARLCGMTYRAPFLFHGSRQRPDEDIAAHVGEYRAWLEQYPMPGQACEQPAVPEAHR